MPATASKQDESAWAFPAEYSIEIGGVVVSCLQVEQALVALRSAASLMIRQPLVKIDSPLAFCDYHAVAAPHRARFSCADVSGRGSAGRHIAKAAFCYALEQALADVQANPAQAFGALLEAAYDAIGSDHAYSAAMARSAVVVQVKRHGWELRSQLRQAAHQAVSACDVERGEFSCSVKTACGTGECRFATGVLVEITKLAGDTGKMTRPFNHVQSGSVFSPDEAQADLENIDPFCVST